MKNLYSIMFHDFKRNNSAGTQGAISEENLYKIIDFYDIDKISNPKLFLENEDNNLEGELFFTFDDGLLSQYEIAFKILEEQNIKGLFFIHTKPLIGEFDIHQITRNFKNSKNFDSVDEFNSLLIKLIKRNFSDNEKGKLNKEFIESKYLLEYKFYSSSDRELRFIRDFKISLEEYEESIFSLIKEKGASLDSLINETYMNKEMVKEISERGHTIGLHSHSHPTNLGSMKEDDQYDELNRNSEILEEIIGYKPKALSFPSNSYNEQTIDLLKKLKINYAFRANDQINLNPYELARVDATYIIEKIMTG